MINLFARCACDTIGKFDWTPYIPHVGIYLLFCLLIFPKIPKSRDYSNIKIKKLKLEIIYLIKCVILGVFKFQPISISYLRYLARLFVV